MRFLRKEGCEGSQDNKYCCNEDNGKADFGRSFRLHGSKKRSFSQKKHKY